MASSDFKIANPEHHLVTLDDAAARLSVEMAVEQGSGYRSVDDADDSLPIGAIPVDAVFTPVRKAVKEHGCTRAVLVGHNPAFDIAFVNAAVERTGYKRNPFHPFSTFDTATLAGLAYGQTVLSRAVEASGLEWDSRDAHSAIYDAEITAALFCRIVNTWDGRFAPQQSSVPPSVC